jgi:hypothetical protein
VSATIVPFNLLGPWAERGRRYRRLVERAAAEAQLPVSEPVSGSGAHGGAGARPTARPDARAGAASLGGGRGAGQPISGCRADRRRAMARARPGRRPGEVGPGTAPGRDVQPRMRPGRQLGRAAAGVPGATEDPRHRRARHPVGRRGDGGCLGGVAWPSSTPITSSWRAPITSPGASVAEARVHRISTSSCSWGHRVANVPTARTAVTRPAGGRRRWIRTRTVPPRCVQSRFDAGLRMAPGRRAAGQGREDQE